MLFQEIWIPALRFIPAQKAGDITSIGAKRETVGIFAVIFNPNRN